MVVLLIVNIGRSINFIRINYIVQNIPQTFRESSIKTKKTLQLKLTGGLIKYTQEHNLLTTSQHKRENPRENPSSARELKYIIYLLLPKCSRTAGNLH